MGEAGVLAGQKPLANPVFVRLHGFVERVGVVGGRRRARFEHLLSGHLAGAGDLVDRRAAPESAGQPLCDDVHPMGQLLDVARRAHRPAEVAEVPFELPQDRWHRERRERDAAGGIEAVDGLDQPEGRDLLQVVLLGACRIPTPQMPCERHVARDERVTVREAPLAPVPLEEPHRLLTQRDERGPLGTTQGRQDGSYRGGQDRARAGTAPLDRDGNDGAPAQSSEHACGRREFACASGELGAGAATRLDRQYGHDGGPSVERRAFTFDRRPERRGSAGTSRRRAPRTARCGPAASVRSPVTGSRRWPRRRSGAAARRCA